MSIIVVSPDCPHPSATLLYEGEWNEGAGPAEHRNAVLWFARESGITLPADAPIGNITDDDAVWIMPDDDLYARATAMGLDFEAGFDDDCLRERVSYGLCVDGEWGPGGRYACAGCAACIPSDPPAQVWHGPLTQRQDTYRTRYGWTVAEICAVVTFARTGSLPQGS